jgi:hypothetical protein
MNHWLDYDSGMNKLVEFPGEAPSGERLIHLVQPTKSGIIKTAAELHPSITAYMSTAERAPHYAYILVVALGAGEVYGQNINGDYFPWEALRHDYKSFEGQRLRYQYGYQSFYDANFFAHHQNKNADRRLGDVVHVVLNESMKRIDLVIRVDRRMCEKFDAMDTWDRVSAGDRIDVSMGARVPFDLCRITTDWELYRQAYESYNAAKDPHIAGAILKFHDKKKAKDGIGIPGLARTRAEYSEQCKTQMGKILSDGRQVGVVNTFPRFFDISDVVIRADRIARQLTKLAAKGRGNEIIVISSAERGEEEMLKVANLVEMEVPGALHRAGKAIAKLWRREEQIEDMAHDPRVLLGLQQPSEYDKFKSVIKTSAYHKTAELLKEISPDMVTGKVLKMLEAREADLPNDALDSAAERDGIRKTLSTASVLGMLLKPKEFQRVVLVGSGNKGMADKYEGKTFEVGKPGTGASLLGKRDLSGAVRGLLLPHIGARSLFMPPLTRRIMMIDVTEPVGPSPEICNDLGDLSSLYTDYRRDLLNMLVGGPLLKMAEADDGILREAYSTWNMEKHANLRNLAGYLTIPALMYLYAAGLRKREAEGEEFGPVKEFIKDNPLLTGGFAAAIAAAAKNPDILKRPAA